MKFAGLTLHRFWAAAGLAAVAHVALFDMRIFTAPEGLQVQYIPDDAYYYLTLARNFAVRGAWTFDSGVSTATGFHPLFAYALSLLYGLARPTPAGFVHCGLALSSIAALTASLIAWTLGLRRGTPYVLIFLTLVVTSGNFVWNTVSVTEWPLVVLCASFYVIVFSHGRGLSSRNRALMLFGTGVLGSLARSDFGLLPFSLFAVGLVVRHFTRTREWSRAPLLGAAGAALGALLVIAHDYVISGRLIQSSARMKAYWAQVSGISFRGPMTLLSNLVVGGGFHSGGVVPLIAVLSAVAAYLLFFVTRKGPRVASLFRPDRAAEAPFHELTLAASAALCIAGYISFYAIAGAALQPWYSGNLVVPVVVLLAVGAGLGERALRGHDRTLMEIGVSVVVLCIAARNVATVQEDFSQSPWPHQKIMFDAGAYLGRHGVAGSIASWNAGIIGYYEGGTVINIDGLVNDDIYEYARTNSLPSYLRQKNVRYVIDFENMLQDEGLRSRGGYDDKEFIASLVPLKAFGTSRYGRLVLYGFHPEAMPQSRRR